MDIQKKSFSNSPLGIKIISIIFYIQFIILFGFFLYLCLLFSAKIVSYNLVFVLLILAVINLFLGWQLPKGNNKIKWIVIIFLIASILISKMPNYISNNFYKGVLDAIVNVIIILYLLFSRKVREYYS